MNTDSAWQINEQHLLQFGTIIHCFARHEALIEEIMAAVSGADVTSIKLMTIELSLTQKRDALFNLLRHRPVPLDQIEQIRTYLRPIQTFAPLRNDIAHSLWVEGRPQNSIWPVWLSHGPQAAVRPLHDVDGDGKQYIKDDETCYSLQDLREISQALAANYVSFQDYTASVGLVRTAVESAPGR